MDDGAALMRAICEFPEEDTPRLALADWLDENGEAERAEFIRLQILLHNTSFIRAGGEHARWPEPWVSRIHRVAALIEERGREWGGTAASQWPAWPGRMFLRWYGRGFVRRVTFADGRFLADAKAVFSAHPVEYVELSGRYSLREPFAPHRVFWHRHEGKYFLPHQVPAVIFDRIDHPKAGWKYSSQANDALSAALVAHGRSLAGLPPLSIPSIAPVTS